MSAIHQVLLASGGGGYQITNSLRFRASNSAYLSRSFGSPTSNIKWTWSGWIKRGALGSQQIFCAGDGSSNNFFAVTYTVSDTIQISQIASGAYNVQMATTAVFRDPSAWYHLVVIYDSANATSTDRIQIYVNNSRQTVSYSTGPFGASTACQWNVSGRTHYLRRLDYVALYGDMYAANETFIDGQALTPSSFGQTDATTGVWVPKSYSGTYGTNGFFLQFKDAASTTTIGYDTSGNSNNFTTSGISVTAGTTFDQMLDTPTNNCATFDAISPIGSASSIGTLSRGNLAFDHSSANYAQRFGSFAVPSGKWYFEYTITTFSSQKSCVFGIGKTADYPSGAGAFGSWTGCVGYGDFGDTYLFPVTESGGFTNAVGVAATTFSVNDVIMIAFDVDAGKFWMGKNGTWFDSGNPSGGTNEKQTFTTGINWRPWCVQYGSSAAQSFANFGQRAFAYTPPTGFKALNTANLPVPSIKKPSTYFDATLRTGTGAAANVSSLAFQPDLVWIKSRSATTDHGLYDSVRGVQKQIESNTTTAETTETTGLTAFGSNGYTVGALAQLNTSAATYVDWAWKEGVTPGFDVVSYVGDNTNRTISHALGAAPKMMIIKRLTDAVSDWAAYHFFVGATKYMTLNSTAAASSPDSTVWNNTSPTSSVFSIGTDTKVNKSPSSYIAYLFAEIAGFSKIDSYTGNGSADGPFVWCGFRPRWLMLKDTAAGSWRVYDAARNPTNGAMLSLVLSSAAADSSENFVDLFSNGFKLRIGSGNGVNDVSTYIFVAFAEAPFKYARAR